MIILPGFPVPSLPSRTASSFPPITSSFFTSFFHVFRVFSFHRCLPLQSSVSSLACSTTPTFRISSFEIPFGFFFSILHLLLREELKGRGGGVGAPTQDPSPPTRASRTPNSTNRAGAGGPHLQDQGVLTSSALLHFTHL